MVGAHKGITRSRVESGSCFMRLFGRHADSVGVHLHVSNNTVAPAGLALVIRAETGQQENLLNVEPSVLAASRRKALSYNRKPV